MANLPKKKPGKPNKTGRVKRSQTAEVSDESISVSKEFNVSENEENKVKGPVQTEAEINEEMEEEVSEDQEAKEAEDEIGADEDQLSKEFRKFFGVHGKAVFFMDFQIPNAPLDKEGRPIKFTRVYLFKKTVVDIVEDNAPEAEILGRKSAAEAEGYRYTWARKGEMTSKDNKGTITPADMFGKRIKPLAKPAPWPYKRPESAKEPSWM